MTVFHSMMKRALMLGGLAALAACGTPSDEASTTKILRESLGASLPSLGGKPKAAPIAPADPAQIAARALAANPAPLILATIESQGRPQAMAMVGQNGTMRSYMNPAEQALIFRSGILSGTKGLGNDLSVAEAEGSAALIRARRAGSAERVMRYISGDGVERPLPMRCDISTGEAQSFNFAGRDWQARQMIESCKAGGLSVQNHYLVSADGQIPVSRQWIGPKMGYVTIQTIRP